MRVFVVTEGTYEMLDQGMQKEIGGDVQSFLNGGDGFLGGW